MKIVITIVAVKWLESFIELVPPILVDVKVNVSKLEMNWKNEKQTLIYKNKRKIRNDRSTWLSAKLIKCFKPGSIKSIVRLERNSEEVSIRFDCFRYLETAVPWDFAVDRSIVWKLNIITSSFCCASKKSRRKKEKESDEG